ncbi:MAG: tetratricopeptide repeat protein [Fimbriimonadales bacterium]
MRGSYAEAYRHHIGALRFWHETGQPRWICWSLNRVAEIELLARDAGSSWRVSAAMGRSAYELLREAWYIIEPTYMNLPHKSRTLHNLGWLAWHEGRIAEAEHYLQQALQIRQSYGNEYGIARTLELLARQRYTQRHNNDAKRYFAQARKIRKRLCIVQYPAVKRCCLSIQRRL